MMNSDAHIGGDGTRDPLSNVPRECYDVLRNPRRLHLLHVLGSTTRPLSVSELTAELAARDEADRRSVRIDLVHSHLPMLADLDVIEFDGEEVALVDDAPVPSDALVTLLEANEESERLLETIVQPERMAVLAILERTTACQLDTLASELAAHDGASVADPEQAAVSLHHSHLPALNDLGVLEYDGRDSIVAVDRGTPLLR